METSLSQQVVVITGAGSGIGRALALRLGAAGARVVVSGRRKEQLDQVADEITSRGGQALVVICDVTSRVDCHTMIATIKATYGDVDILINNAGRADQGLVSLLDDAALDEMMALNVKGPLYLIQAVLPAMRRRNSGHILNVITHAAFHGFGLTPGYAAAKSALKSITQNLRYELCDTDIQVTAVYPGLVDTGFAAAMAPPGTSPTDFMAWMRHFRAGQRASEEFKRIEVPQRPDQVAAIIEHALREPGQLEVFTQAVHHESAVRMLQDPRWWHQESTRFYQAFLVPLRDMMQRFVEITRTR